MGSATEEDHQGNMLWNVVSIQLVVTKEKQNRIRTGNITSVN